MKRLLVILREEEAGGYFVECPQIPGCFSEGDTKEEALANIQEAILGCLESRHAHGLPLFVSAETSEVEIPRLPS